MGKLRTESNGSPFTGVTKFSFDPHLDFRGGWQRLWNRESILSVGHTPHVEQVSISTNPHTHTLRGLHSLKYEVSEFKAVVCLTGSIQDIVVDVRPNSPTWGTYASFNLNVEGLNGVLIPPGFAHGFLTLAPDTRLLYLMSIQHEVGLENNFCWNDPEFKINWQASPALVSDKDNNIPWFASR